MDKEQQVLQPSMKRGLSLCSLPSPSWCTPHTCTAHFEHLPPTYSRSGAHPQILTILISLTLGEVHPLIYLPPRILAGLVVPRC